MTYGLKPKDLTDDQLNSLLDRHWRAFNEHKKLHDELQKEARRRFVED